VSDAKPWEDEPDSLDFEHCGLPCAIRRHSLLGHLNGYVGVPDGHPLCYVDFSSGDECLSGKSPECYFEVHGGLTYSARGTGKYLSDGFWWFGFDCSHADDLIPEMANAIDTYRDINFVCGECKKLAEQLVRLSHGCAR